MADIRHIAVIGLGSMGSGIAANALRAGHSVLGCDVDRAKEERFREDGGMSGTLADLAGDLDAVVTVVLNAVQTEAVLFGPEGVAPNLRPGAVVVSSATVAPDVARALERRCADLGVHYLDAPISGGAGKAASGELTVMASGTPEAFAAARPVLDAVSTTPRWTEEFLVGYRTIREQTASALNAPLFLVEADQPGIYLAGGSVSAAQGTILNQDLLELANDLSVTLGSHRVTLGAQAALSGFIDNLFINARGVWRFPSVDALERREPNRYEVSLPLRAGGPVADFGAQMLSAYLQDRWTPSERLAVTAGVRVDAPFIDAPLTNPVLAASAALGHLDTGDFPSGNTALSPRLGVVLDLSRTWRTVLRAGAGVFTAQPPMAWLGGAFSNTGLDQQSLICTPQDGVPPPVTNPADRPSACTGSAGQPSPPSNIVTFAPGFRFPQAEKLLIGLDHALGAGITASVDVMRTHTRHAVYLTDVNLTPGTPTSEGRAMYGSLNATGVAVTTRPEQEQFRQVARYENRSGDRSRSLTVSLRKAWERGGFVQVGGQWAHATDAFTINRISAMLTLQATPIDGTLAERRRTRSGYDVPVSLTTSGAVPLGAGLTVAWLARHQSGRPYAYAVTGDANADGIASNDLFFVPSRADDISLAAADQYEVLDRFIAGEACLDRQRGRIMARNSCRNPAFTTLDTRLSWAVPFSRRPLEIDIDVFNLANLLHRRWGLVRETSAGEAKTGLVSLVGWDAANNRPRYTLATSGGAYLVPARRQVLTDLSRWRMQLGARLHF